MGDEQDLVYWERQEAGLCGVHAVNSLLQGPYVTAVDLMQIAQALDAQEKALMAEQGVQTKEFLEYLAEESGNVALDGNFSVSVISEALKVFNLVVEDMNHPAMKDAKENPLREVAFLANLASHWFAIRKVNGRFVNLNSLAPGGPEVVSDFYLQLLLDSLLAQNYTIFVVRGVFPVSSRDIMNDSFGSGGGEWRKPLEAGDPARRGAAAAPTAQEEDDLAAAIAASMQEDEDAAMAAAIAASLAD